jgi:hypothetical protein
MRLLPAFSILLATVCAAFAQTSALTGDGRRPVEKPGIALVKPQKWSTPAQAQPVRFTAYTNRGGYFVLRLPNGQDRQVWVAQLVGEAPVVQPDLPAELVDATQREALAARIAEIQSIAQQAPAARTALENLLQPLAEMLARFDSGEVFSAGKWESAASYRIRQFHLLESRLRATLALESSKAKFNLPENAAFLQMRALAAGAPDLQAKLEKLRADHERLVSLERQAALTKQLSQPGITPAATSDILNRLRAYPDPAERTALILNQAETAKLLTSETALIQKNLEDFFAQNSNPVSIPVLPNNLSTRIQTLATEVEKFHASSPPAAIQAPPAARAAISIDRQLPPIAAKFASREFVDVANLLAALETDATSIGPASLHALLVLKTEATARVDRFSKLRSQGEEAETKGDTPAAIAKFQEALEILPDSALQARVARLQSPATLDPSTP